MKDHEITVTQNGHVTNDAGVLRRMAAEVKECNLEKGWYDAERTFGDEIALLHSELSEALEAFRDHGTEDVTKFTDNPLHALPKPEGIGSEFADVLVRLLDTCERYNIDLFAEWRRKVDFNWTRSHRHGNRAL